jgi:hypothetical protein
VFECTSIVRVVVLRDENFLEKSWNMWKFLESTESSSIEIEVTV